MTTPLWPIAPGARPQIVDLSDNNPRLNTLAEFHALKAVGVEAVYHKLTQGTNHVDPLYAIRRPLAIAAGLIWLGPYHFCTAGMATAQASFFIEKAMAAEGGNLKAVRLMIDAELNRGSTIKPADAVILARLVDRAVDHQALRYGNASVPEYARAGWHDGPMWWAKYGPEPTVELMQRLGVDPAKVVLWQNSGDATVAGEKPIDTSYYRFGAAGGLQVWPIIPGFDGAAPAAG